ncbi:fungal-specific transcription factor domain-containing protein [Emericellopsis atlantica]|uniref:Fungal-specific transcription factor domain-containing protein n=1 Tax=Emericellopsis atlantica TaxID=2614577 RepID=A0A9P7ZWM9_9HYPO|nr:fungal-specific transcription factor domain-containing protein [Emericellopsis atlantica]KAG9258858.1 fungal-specific transcription factor domain-containing protein [Emericellopsis atlantica]
MNHESELAVVGSQSPEGDLDDGQDDKGAQNRGSSNSDGGPARKRRRSRKGLSKRFECPTEGCGKSYSRAEHLYRHQLNHSSKTVFRCSFPDCTRTFVRGDLLKRHMDRHTAKGSQLSRRDSVLSHVSQSGNALGSASPETARPATDYQQQRAHSGYQHDGSYSPITPAQPGPYTNGGHVNGHHNLGSYHYPISHEQPHSPVAPANPTADRPYGVSSPVPNQQQRFTGSAPVGGNYVPQHNMMSFDLGPSQYGNGSGQQVSQGDVSQSYAAGIKGEYTESQQAEMMMLGQMGMPGTVPVFGSDILNKSPYAGLPEDFLSYLFNTSSPGERSPVSKDMMQAPYSSYGDLNNAQYSIPYVGQDPGSMGYFPSAPQQVMAVNNLLEQNVPEADISEEKCQELFDLIRDRFHEKDEAPIDRRRDSILDGDRSVENHMLSKRMMQAYIGSYWYHFSEQLPILHKPTFSPNSTPNLLLLSMMTIGAALLDRTHGTKVVKAGAKLSNFLAWHLRWEIFQDVGARPPAKLWIFQALILLELYEKMYSTRELHERAHIHHATTIQLMRRGRALIGKSSVESPPHAMSSVNGSRHSSTSGVAQTAEEWWNQWITNEATRRAAFAAFVVDSLHATMFGHSGVMVAHEMRLPLPCDESLWQATSSAEVGRLESNLFSRGIKPVSFLEGLKRTLSGQDVQTNSFGRTVLMTGLLSVSWHMHQRDLQVNVLGGGVGSSLGGRDKWRATLTRAYDIWKADFDKSLPRSDADPYHHNAAKRNEFNIVFESRTVLHHLAHMAMHADIVDVQMFARAKRLLGRAIGPQEFKSAERRIKDAWAPSARARDATYYALKFLCSVLIPDAQGPSLGGAYHHEEPYRARDDVLLNRPWVMYFAMLVVWCYGYALEGPSSHVAYPSSHREKMQQMRDYLTRFGSISNPHDLQQAKGLNCNTALLLVLKDTFEETRWELLHEGSNLLNNCITLNSGAMVS